MSPGDANEDRSAEAFLLKRNLIAAALGYRLTDFAAAALDPGPGRDRSRRRRKAERPPDGLLTPAEAAARLRCSLKTLRGHVASGVLRYVQIGHGKRRPAYMFTDADLTEFIEAQTRKDVPCPSSATRARRSGGMTFSGEVIAFSAQPRPRPSVKPKR